MGRSSIKNIAYISGTRADFGLMKEVLHAVNNQGEWNLKIIACGMHLMPQHGMTVSEIEHEGFDVARLDTVYEDDSREAMAIFIGKTIVKITQTIEANAIDTLLLLGDRGEMLAGAIAGAYSGKLVVHFHGGDRTSTIDEPVRHSISKLAHLHFPAIEESKDRLLKMGESDQRIFVVGSPGLEGIAEDLMSHEQLHTYLDVPVEEKLVLVLFHPVTEDFEESGEQMKTLLEGIYSKDKTFITIFPNADAGNRKIIEIIREYNERSNFIAFDNLPRRTFLSLMKHAFYMVGNSSSGIIEAASFGTPVIDIGERQHGRLHAENVIHAKCDYTEIQQALSVITDNEQFLQQLAEVKNPYGDGRTSDRVVKILKQTYIAPSILQKNMTY